MATTQPVPPTREPAARKKRNPWIWISALLVVVAAGLLIWALTIQSDLDGTQQQVDDLQAEVEQGQSAGSAVGAAAKGLYEDLAQELGATTDDLEQTQQELTEAKQDTVNAEQAAADAKQAVDDAGDATEKARAEADQAKAELQAAESKAGIAADCAKAYVAAFGTALEGEAAGLREQIDSITADCRTALDGA